MLEPQDRQMVTKHNYILVVVIELVAPFTGRTSNIPGYSRMYSFFFGSTNDNGKYSSFNVTGHVGVTSLKVHLEEIYISETGHVETVTCLTKTHI